MEIIKNHCYAQHLDQSYNHCVLPDCGLCGQAPAAQCQQPDHPNRGGDRGHRCVPLD